jgi:acyl-CoA thioesterase-1
MRRSNFPRLGLLLLRTLAAAALAAAVARLPGRAEAAPPEKTIIFFGDSLTAGYGLADPAAEAYPALIQKKVAAAGLPWRVVNAGLSGETSSDGLHRVRWILRQPVDIFVLALGANDGLRGLAPALLKSNLHAIIARVRAADPAATIVLAGMRMSPSLGADYVEQFAAVFPAVAGEEKVRLIPFLLDGVGGHPELNQADGIHPTPAGAAIVADTVWQALQPLLTER